INQRVDTGRPRQCTADRAVSLKCPSPLWCPCGMAQLGRPSLGRAMAGGVSMPLPRSRLIILLILLVALFDIACSGNSDKNVPLCRAAGGMCKTKASCGPRNKQLSGQLCGGSNLVCCIHT
ncbi:unnamed protein product, partial [Meganyctiphanes norvegica]